MDEDPSLLDLDHTDDRTGYLGLSHRTCNRTQGRRTVPRYRNMRARRVCVRCFAVYQPSHADQRYCGRPCAAAAVREETARRRAAERARREAERPPHPCPTCGTITTRLYSCNDPVCVVIATREYMRNRYRRRVGIPTDAPKWTRATAP